MTICGIDPGHDGGLALMDGRGTLLALREMPSTMVRVNRTNRPRMDAPGFRDLLREWAPQHVIIEEIRARKGDGPRAGDLREAFGVARGVVIGLNIPLSFADPLVWRRRCGVSVPGGTTEDRKEASRLAARQLFPAFAKELATKASADMAEAALMARFGLMDLRVFEIARGDFA